MKKLSLIATAALVLAAASCKKDSDDGPSAVGGFSARTESDVGKTALNSTSVVWKSGDNIQVFSEGGYAKYWLTKGANTTSAYFEMVDGTQQGGYLEEAAEHIAVYPYKEAGLTCDVENKTITGFKLPQTQTYAENSFGNGAFPMFAHTTDMNFDFLNLCGVLRLSLYDLPWPVKGIIVTSSEPDERLWGTGTVKVVGNDGKPHLTGTLESGGNSVYLDCGENGVECNGGKGSPTYFHIVLPEGAFENNGFNVTVECKSNDGGYGYKHTVSCARANRIERSQVTCMPEKEFYCVDLGLPSGRLWAPCNLGVEPDETTGEISETACGDYYAWGATDTWYVQPLALGAPGTGSGTPEAVTSQWKANKEKGYVLATARFQTVPDVGDNDYSSTRWRKYVSKSSLYCDESYGGDNKLELDADDDAAAELYGGAWRMPTPEDFVELRDNCDIEWVTKEGGVTGMEFTSKSNGKTVFLRAAGFCLGTSRNYAGSGYYWSRSLYSSSPYYAYYSYFSSGSVGPSNLHRYRSYGFTVRPVL